MRLRTRLAAVTAASLLLAGCAGPGGAPSAPEQPADAAPTAAPDERAAMECVTGAWVAETAALQELFDAAAGGAGPSLTVEGSIVYEFIEHGFGLTVIPTAFAMRMATPVGDVVGEFTGQATGIWTVRGDEIHVASDAWQSGLATRWTFDGADFEVDTGTQEMTSGFTDVDRFSCAGDELVMQSAGAPPLTLTRMVDVG